MPTEFWILLQFFLETTQRILPEVAKFVYSEAERERKPANSIYIPDLPRTAEARKMQQKARWGMGSPEGLRRGWLRQLQRIAPSGRECSTLGEKLLQVGVRTEK